MPFVKWLVPDELFKLACLDLEAKRQNNGCWANDRPVGFRIPPSIVEIMKLYNTDNVSVAEQVVGSMAIAKMAELVGNELTPDSERDIR